MKLAPYAKFIVAALIAGLTALQAALTDSTITSEEWLTIALATVGALGVFAVPNKPAEPHDPTLRA